MSAWASPPSTATAGWRSSTTASPRCCRSTTPRWRSARRRREFGATPEIVALLRRPDTPQTHEIATRDGRVIELRLDPLPGGGFVATCNDVTARVRTAEALRDSDRQLRQSAETLEQRVVERTAELEASRAEAEAANLGKTRFIAAASHDLLQPLHAARLFTAAMIDRDPGQRSRRQDRRQPGRGRIAARCAARHLQARCRRLQAGEAAVRPAAAVRIAGHRLRAGGGAPRRRAGGGADARLRVDRSGLPAPHPAEPAVQCAALRQGRGPAGARAAGLPPGRRGAAHRGQGQRAGHRRRQAGDHLRRVRAPAGRGRRAARGAWSRPGAGHRRPHRAHARPAGGARLGAGPAARPSR